jgi:MFS family permease
MHVRTPALRMIDPPREAAVRRRLRPIFLASFFQSVALWVPIEKLFITAIGFDNGGVALMAAAYAAVVPLLEVPSGILADRWSRRGVALIGQAALVVSAVVGGLSTDVAIYIVAAAFLGVHFAMNSGTYEAIVYDTLLDETGDAALFERTIGRIRVVESMALVAGAFGGGFLAEVVPLRATYFLTVPFVATAAIALLRFREPRRHEAADEVLPLRRQIAATYHALVHRRGIRSIVALLVLTALLLQMMLEFGPLWLVTLAAPPALFGPQWAGLMAALGLGGLLGGHIALTRRVPAAALGVAVPTCCLVLTVSHDTGTIIGAQVLLVLLVVAVSIPLTARLHDAVPSTIRAGVASGVGTLSWLAFLPFALVFGAISDRRGVPAAGWTLVAAAVLTLVLLTWPVRGLRQNPAGLPLAPAYPEEAFAPADDPDWPGHWVSPPAAWERLDERVDALNAVRSVIADLPSPQHEVIVARDVDRRPPVEVSDALQLRAADVQDLLHQARGRVRARLDRLLAGDQNDRP